MQYGEQAAAIVAACRRLHARGLLAGTEGNVSVRLSETEMLITPSGADKASLEESDMVVASIADGTDRHSASYARTAGDAGASDKRRRASSEIGMHRSCYQLRPDVGAIVHAHPPVATGLATAGKTIPANLVPELPVIVGPIALVPYARPGTPLLGEAMKPFIPGHEVFLLANHGVTAVAGTVEEALQRMESTEQAAHVLFVAQVMGGAGLLSHTEVADLAAMHPRAAAHRAHQSL